MADTPADDKGTTTEAKGRVVPLAEARALAEGVVERNYYGASGEIQGILTAAGIAAPGCPVCGEAMVQVDDHGRWTCFCNVGQVYQLGIWA